MNTLKLNQKVFFIGEKLPMTVMAISERYAVVSRKLHRRQDADLLHYEVKMDGYCTFTEAFNDLKDNPVYSILDFKEKVRAPDNLVFGAFDYSKKEDCEEAIKWLEDGTMELSQRNKVEMQIDWDRTSVNK